MQSVRHVLGAFAGLCLGVMPAIAAPGDPIGSAILIKQDVRAELVADVRQLAIGDPVRHQETIIVGADSTSELELVDKTKLALGPGSRIVLDEFVYNPDKSGGSIILNLLQGTFRFVTGVASKPSYIINTPTASISVRGTIFDLFVRSDGSAWILLLDGGTEICNARLDCKVHDKPGYLLPIDADGNLGELVKWTALPGRTQYAFADAFPFVESPPSIDPTPIFTAAAIMAGLVPDEKVTPPKNNDNYDKPKRKSKPKRKAKRKTKPRRKVTTKRRPKRNNDQAAKDAAAALITGLAIYGAIKGGKKKKHPRHPPSDHHRY